MYDVIYQIIGHAYQGTNSYGEQQYIYYVCCAMIPLLAVVFIDLIRGIFSGFFRG